MLKGFKYAGLEYGSVSWSYRSFAKLLYTCRNVGASMQFRAISRRLPSWSATCDVLETTPTDVALATDFLYTSLALPRVSHSYKTSSVTLCKAAMKTVPPLASFHYRFPCRTPHLLSRSVSALAPMLDMVCRVDSPQRSS